MANKEISDLQPISAVTDVVNFPVDDGTQTYRATALQITNYILKDNNVPFSALAEALQQALIPAGSILPFAGTAAPNAGFLLCQGQAVSRTTYAALFAVIGTTHGQGDGTTTFNLPDYRGRFLRGVAGGSTNDPDRAARTAMATGGNTGDNVGSVQGHAFQTHTHIQDSHNHSQNSHNHAISYWQPSGGGNGLGGGASSVQSGTGYTTATNNPATATNQNASASGTTAQATANETRPVNAYVNYLIKV